MRSEVRSSGEIGAEVERRQDRSGEIEQRSAAIDKQRSAIVGLELGLWLLAKSLLPLSLRSGLSLSFGSLRCKFPWLSLSFARGRKRFEGKINL